MSKGSTQGGYTTLPTQAPARDALRTDFSLQTGEQVFELIVLNNVERNAAEDLGTLDRFPAWQQLDFYETARVEWLSAWKQFARKHDLGTLFKLRAGLQQTLEPIKAFTLAALRRGGKPEVILRNQAAVIAAAWLQRDREFLKKIRAAKRVGKRANPQRGFLQYNILRYWFARGAVADG